MNDLMSVVDWSRAQFALTAMYHWLFVPLTLGISVIVAIMETIYVRTKSQKWLDITKFWMLLFGINFAVGVATGIILEFEFGTNWSNYSWFVGDIFGAPLAIEGIVAFFMESTFIAVMFFGWKKVSPKFHLTATWLTAIGATLSALWILIANAWMQYPVGMRFDPEQMRNVMDSFTAVVFSPVAMHKFAHAVADGWVVGAVFVIGVSCWFLWKKRRRNFAFSSIKVAGWVGLVGILVTLWTGDGSAVDVARVQPMKLAAMEGLYRGECGQSIVAAGILNPGYAPEKGNDEFICAIRIPKMLSLLATHSTNGFVAGIDDLIDGIELTPDGDTINTVSYAERIAIGKQAHECLRAYDKAYAAGDTAAMVLAAKELEGKFQFFGYGYLDSPKDAVPPIALTFYSFHIMVICGGYLLALFVLVLLLVYKQPGWLNKPWVQWIGMISIPIVWVCSECGWITAEVGRQPWIIEGLMPTKAAISNITSATVMTTFWMFAVVFTAFLAAEVCIMLKQISIGSRKADVAE
ncbi:MAG: cytochrome ubiquinol oxidase subunit I [Muribaculum sp.]|nr:cytochrome ubiquinol oxidase subunit I [Muribaculaceae bacterium]MCM1081644.1 cytochrome ubiquinol oxidase subunit I [Muribaculum sp.]